MGIKKKLGLGLATAALGLSLVGGGTYAYFSDKADATSSFAAGTIDLSAKPKTIINVKNIKPGDSMIRTFQLVNNGSLDIKRVLLTTDYTVNNQDGTPGNSEDFGKYIKVNFLINEDKGSQVIYSTTLADLKAMTPDAIEKSVFTPNFEKKGLKPGTTDDFVVQFEFIDNNQDQNQFQGDSLSLQWTFDGRQDQGSEK